LHVASKILTTLANATYFLANETLKYVNEQNKLEYNEEKSLTEKILTGSGVALLCVGACFIFKKCCCDVDKSTGRSIATDIGNRIDETKFQYGTW
jgi:hypothetical protein